LILDRCMNIEHIILYRQDIEVHRYNYIVTFIIFIYKDETLFNHFDSTKLFLLFII
jgi:hypothetical protein